MVEYLKWFHENASVITETSLTMHIIKWIYYTEAWSTIITESIQCGEFFLNLAFLDKNILYYKTVLHLPQSLTASFWFWKTTKHYSWNHPQSKASMFTLLQFSQRRSRDHLGSHWCRMNRMLWQWLYSSISMPSNEWPFCSSNPVLFSLFICSSVLCDLRSFFVSDNNQE